MGAEQVGNGTAGTGEGIDDAHVGRRLGRAGQGVMMDVVVDFR